MNLTEIECLYVQVVWESGQTDRQMDGRMDGRTDGWIEPFLLHSLQTHRPVWTIAPDHTVIDTWNVLKVRTTIEADEVKSTNILKLFMLRLLAVFDWMKPFINCTQLQLKKRKKELFYRITAAIKIQNVGLKKEHFYILFWQ